MKTKLDVQRIKSADDALTLYQTLKQADSARESARAKVEGQMAGNLPYNPDVLKSRGQGYRSNVNFRELEGNAKLRLGSFIRLLFDVPVLVRVRVTDETINPNLRVYYGDIIAQEFHALLGRSFAFILNFVRSMRNMVVHGPGIMFWKTERDLIPSSASPGKVLFMDNAGEDPDEYDVVMIRDDLKWDTLMDLISSKSKESAASTRGWNMSVVRDLLQQFANSCQEPAFPISPESDEDYQRLQARRNVLSSNEGKPRTVPVVFIFARESDGRISKSILVDDGTYRESIKGDDKYLYRNDGEHDDFDDVLIAMLTEVGNDGIHAIRGYGHKTYPHAVMSNRMLNTGVDGAIVSSTMIVQSPTGRAQSMTDLLRIGPITVIDETQKIVTGSLSMNLSPLVEMRSLLQANAANSFGAARPAAEGSVPGSSYKTARQTSVETMRLNMISNTETMIFYLFADRIYQSIFRRMQSPKLSEKSRDMVRHFKERCIKRGVPENVMDEFLFEVSAFRAIGNGSQEMSMAITREMLAIAPYLPEEGKRAVIRDFISARAGADNVERYMPMLSPDNLTTFSQQIARFEMNDMMLGGVALVSPDDDHVYHLKRHLMDAQNAIRGYMQQRLDISAAEMVQFLAATITHVTEHLAYIAGELNKPVMEQAQDALNELRVFHKKMQNAARAEQAEAEKQAAAQQDLLAKAIEAVQGDDIKLQLARLAEEFRLKTLKAQMSERVRTMEKLSKMQMAEAESSARINNMNRETDAKIRSSEGGWL